VTVPRHPVLSRVGPGVVILGMGAMGIGACNALFGIRELDDGVAPVVGADAARPDASPFAGWTATCAACALANCGSESSACAADPIFCEPYESCLGACDGDPACRSRCTIDNLTPAAGSPLVSALGACLASHCESDCKLDCGAFAAYLAEPGAAATCDACLKSNACQDARACGSSSDCDAYWRCYAACPTPDCRFACALEHDAGLQLLRPLQEDYSGICATPCAYGNYWACVGNVSWPGVSAPSVELVVPVIDFTNHLPVSGETVSVCLSCPCGTSVTPVLAQGTTDDAGTVSLAVPQIVSAADVGLMGCVEVTSPDASTVPYFGYWGYPFSQAVVNPALGPGSPAANLAAQSAQVFTPAEFAGATQYIGVTQLSGRGSIGAAVFDCLGNPAGGVQVAIDSHDPLITVYSASDDAGTTTAAGLAFFYNVPPGTVQVTATPVSLGRGPSSVETVIVAADTTTAVGMFPTPVR
jgi:hypothetical protein